VTEMGFVREIGYFRPPWRPPHRHIRSVPTPLGAVCIHCDEPIAPDDDGMIYSNGPAAHYECSMRQTIGGVNHQLGRCRCVGGDDPEDPPDLSRREMARLAVALFERSRRDGRT
jgi:hypothetical protein